jgi:phosphoribosylformylglycinamidine synthase
VVTLKPVVNDPQGLAVTQGLHALGYPEVLGTRVGKHIQLTLTAKDRQGAESRVEEMCRRLLCNGVIEDFHFQVAEAGG